MPALSSFDFGSSPVLLKALRTCDTSRPIKADLEEITLDKSGPSASSVKSEGDVLSKGESVVVIESDKADMDVETFYHGSLAAIVAGESETAQRVLEAFGFCRRVARTTTLTEALGYGVKFTLVHLGVLTRLVVIVDESTKTGLWLMHLVASESRGSCYCFWRCMLAAEEESKGLTSNFQSHQSC
ncbi:hypothetical protein ACFX1T_010028 [Malus domestica]